MDGAAQPLADEPLADEPLPLGVALPSVKVQLAAPKSNSTNTNNTNNTNNNSSNNSRRMPVDRAAVTGTNTTYVASIYCYIQFQYSLSFFKMLEDALGVLTSLKSPVMDRSSLQDAPRLLKIIVNGLDWQLLMDWNQLDVNHNANEL